MACHWSVNVERKRSLALRLDAIRQAFDPIHSVWQADQRQIQNQNEGIDYQIVSFRAMVLDASSGPGSLRNGSGCWKVAATGGSPTVELIIKNTSVFDRLNEIVAVTLAQCRPAATSFFLEERSDPTGQWTYLGECQVHTSPSAAHSPCRVDLAGQRELRLRFPTQGGKIGLSSIALR